MVNGDNDGGDDGWCCDSGDDDGGDDQQIPC